uniref:Uncharacterized protein n=1 Tax=Aegilops tauschii subsp. strangulata TaxID=200361 RepID=A0A453EQK8_AEGTS
MVCSFNPALQISFIMPTWHPSLFSSCQTMEARMPCAVWYFDAMLGSSCQRQRSVPHKMCC